MQFHLLNRIEMNPKILCGKPVIKGTRISVEQILAELASGYDMEEISREYDLAEEDIRAAITYAYRLVADEEILEVAG